MPGGRERAAQGNGCTMQGRERTAQGRGCTAQGREHTAQGREHTAQGREHTAQAGSPCTYKGLAVNLNHQTKDNILKTKEGNKAELTREITQLKGNLFNCSLNHDENESYLL